MLSHVILAQVWQGSLKDATKLIAEHGPVSKSQALGPPRRAGRWSDVLAVWELCHGNLEPDIRVESSDSCGTCERRGLQCGACRVDAL